MRGGGGSTSTSVVRGLGSRIVIGSVQIMECRWPVIASFKLIVPWMDSKGMSSDNAFRALKGGSEVGVGRP